MPIRVSGSIAPVGTNLVVMRGRDGLPSIRRVRGHGGMNTVQEAAAPERRRSTEEDDRRFFKKALAFFVGSAGLGALAVCCALVAPLFVASVAGAVFGFISGIGGVAVAVGTGGVLAARAIRKRW